MAGDFSGSVGRGMSLSKRIYYGKDAYMLSAQPRSESMSLVNEDCLPRAVMVYAEIYDPLVVDNPDIPSYQPYVHGRCEPPALIPLNMHGISMEIDLYLDTAFITVSGLWRVHCVAGGKSCDCRLALPMGEEGSVLGVEVESPLTSYYTDLVVSESAQQSEKLPNLKDGFLIKGRIYTLRIPQVDGGTELSVKISWSQKLSYRDGLFSLHVPFTFPSYVVPLEKKLPKKETILVNVNIVSGTEVLFECCSHPLKRRNRDEMGKIELSCERDVSSWSMNDFIFSYNVSSGDTVSGVLLQTPDLHDHDQREIFCLYLYPGRRMKEKVFRKEMVFLVDISASMAGSPLENVKQSLITAVLAVNSTDSFNIIAFNHSSSSFSASMVPAIPEMVEKATEWIGMNFITEGNTNISTPFSQAIDMFSKNGDVLHIMFLITDGSVEDERDICDTLKDKLMKGDLTSPRICTFGIGSYCNHYFLQMLAQIGRGYHDAVFDADSINLKLDRLITNASSVILADVTIDALKNLDSVELYPFNIPDISSECPMLISGRYSGKFPDFIEVGGTLPDLSYFSVNSRVKQTKHIPLDRVFARRQINAITSQAWFSGSKSLEEKATKLSLLTRIPSEYTIIALLESRERFEKATDIKDQKQIFQVSLGIGFGNIKATMENRVPEITEPKLYESQEMIFKAASNCCGRMVNCCCCMCFIQFCNQVNDQCAIAFTQLCTVLACFGCMEICCDLLVGD